MSIEGEMRSKCNHIVGYELGFSHIDDGVWVEEQRIEWVKNRYTYQRLSNPCKYCPDCGKKIVVKKSWRSK